MTKTALEKLNDKQKLHLGLLKEDYKNNFRIEETRSRIGEYLCGLRDAGTLTEIERRSLFCYYTL